MSANSQLINFLKGPGYDPTAPFPEITSTNPCPQFMLMTGTVAGAFTISDKIPLPGQDPTIDPHSATAQCAIWVEYWSSNNKKSALIYTDSTLTAIQTAIG